MELQFVQLKALLALPVKHWLKAVVSITDQLVLSGFCRLPICDIVVLPHVVRVLSAGFKYHVEVRAHVGYALSFCGCRSRNSWPIARRNIPPCDRAL